MGLILSIRLIHCFHVDLSEFLIPRLGLMLFLDFRLCFGLLVVYLRLMFVRFLVLAHEVLPFFVRGLVCFFQMVSISIFQML